MGNLFSSTFLSLQKRVTYDPILGQLSIVVSSTTRHRRRHPDAPPGGLCSRTEYPHGNRASGTRCFGGGVRLEKRGFYTLHSDPQSERHQSESSVADGGYRAGLEQKIVRKANGDAETVTDPLGIISLKATPPRRPHPALGPGLAVVANPDFMIRRRIRRRSVTSRSSR